MITQFHNVKILRDHSIQKEDLWIADGQIISPQNKADRQVNGNNLLIAPGFIDLQINGAYGCDFSSNAYNLSEVKRKLPEHGVTSFLPTVVTSTQDYYLHSLPLLQPCEGGEKGASILGIHLEGPFLNPLYPGAHSSELFRSCLEFPDPEKFFGSLTGVKMVTLAPELPGALAFISILRSYGIIVSAGHTAVTCEQMNEAIDHGVGMATHLFNAMSPMHHRFPGLIGAVLNRPGFFYSLISDGIHLHPVTINQARRCQPKGLTLVSDATSAFGMPQGTYSLGIKKIEIRNQTGYLEGTETFGGSIQGMDAVVRNFQKFTDCSITEALEAASLKPAQILGIYPKKGALNIGSDADFVVLDETLDVQACYVNGFCGFNKFF